MIIQVTYDLKKPGQNYSNLIDRIKTIGSSWAKPCESSWLIDTSKTPKQVYDILISYIDSNDRLLISRFDIDSCVGWLGKEVTSWIDSRRSNNRFANLR